MGSWQVVSNILIKSSTSLPSISYVFRSVFIELMLDSFQWVFLRFFGFDLSEIWDFDDLIVRSCFDVSLVNRLSRGNYGKLESMNYYTSDDLLWSEICFNSFKNWRASLKILINLSFSNERSCFSFSYYAINFCYCPSSSISSSFKSILTFPKSKC